MYFTNEAIKCFKFMANTIILVLIDLEQKILISAPPLEHLNIANNTHNYHCSVLRLDKINAWYGGNKYYKLKKNLEAYYSGNYSSIITFGGAYSNHIYSLAAIGKELGIKTIGYIRGLEPDKLSSTLNFAKECGMELVWISRTDYSLKNEKVFVDTLQKKHPNCLLIPEGASNDLGIEGCKEITREINFDFDYIIVACGTGSTLAGIVSGLKPHQIAIGISVVKGIDRLSSFVCNKNPEKRNNFKVLFDYHYGGYAKKSFLLEQFVTDFYKENKVPLDMVYTAKAMAGLFDLMKRNHFEPHSKIVFVHTGGLQNGEMAMGN
jgi:1-aminocyclopropane-1-carboxylate deaminase